MSIEPKTTIGSVHLTTSDLDRSVRFYETNLGFTLHGRDGQSARLGAGKSDLLVLTESPTASPRGRGTTGLYHFAILVPSRLDLACVLQRLVDTSTRMQGFADHGVSEALYLADPDGNGIEVYRDRPRPEWPMAEGRLQMGTAPLAVDALLAELDGRENRLAGLGPETTVGHVHLQVSDLAAAETFYVRLLGFDLMQRYGRAALFVSAGGYHHHIGLNTWAGEGAPPPPVGAIGLRHFGLRVPSLTGFEDVRRRLSAAGVATEESNAAVFVRDPSGNTIAISVSA